MFREWCETCKGAGTIDCENAIGFKVCIECKGEGYTEHEGELADLELAAAFKWSINEGILNDIFIHGNEIEHLGYLIEVYRREAGVKHDKPKKSGERPRPYNLNCNPPAYTCPNCDNICHPGEVECNDGCGQVFDWGNWID